MMRPITFSNDDAPEGPRIGGPAPIGMDAEFTDNRTQYFGTFPFNEGTEFSIFHRFEIFGKDPRRDIIDHNNQILSPSHLIWVSVHARSRRAASSPGSFSPVGLLLRDPQSDVAPDNPDVANRRVYSESKLFGQCYIQRHAVMDAVPKLESDGYIHLLQIGLHGTTLIDGFPWDPGYLNVWALAPDDPTTYRFCIQQ